MVSNREVVIIDSENRLSLSIENAVYLLNWILPLTKAEVHTSRTKASLDIIDRIDLQIKFRLTVDGDLNPQLTGPGPSADAVTGPLTISRQVVLDKPQFVPEFPESEEIFDARLYANFYNVENKKVMILPTSNVQIIAKACGLMRTPVVMTVNLDNHRNPLSQVLYDQKDVLKYREFIEGTVKNYPVIKLDLGKARDGGLQAEARKVLEEVKGQLVGVKAVPGGEVADFTPTLDSVNRKLAELEGKFEYSVRKLEEAVTEAQTIKYSKAGSLRQALNEIRTIREQQAKLAEMLQLTTEHALPTLAALTAQYEACKESQVSLRSELQQIPIPQLTKPLLLTVAWAGRTESHNIGVQVSKRKTYDLSGVVKLKNGRKVLAEQRFEMKTSEMLISVGDPGHFSAAGEFIVQIEDQAGSSLSADFQFSLAAEAGSDPPAEVAGEGSRLLPLRPYDQTLIYTQTENIAAIEAHLLEAFGQLRVNMLRKLASSWLNEGMDQLATLITAVCNADLSSEEAVIAQLKEAGFEFNFS